MSENQYYVYIYLNPLKSGKYTYGDFISFQFEPFYVGFGKGSRIVEHTEPKNLEKNSNRHFMNTLIKIKNNGFSFIREKLNFNLSVKEAKELEIFYIKNIGRHDLNLGPLTNMTDGGDGGFPLVPWNKGKKMSEEYCKKNSEAQKGKKQSQETIRKRQQTIKERKQKGLISSTTWNKGKKYSRGSSPRIFFRFKQNDVIIEILGTNALEKFCEENNLSCGCLKQLINKYGRYATKSYKGYERCE